jgi:hypothetical protein
MLLYVSDFLAELIDASEVREIVRGQCEGILFDVPQKTADQLREPLKYISGKCMGYPAIWFASNALQLNEDGIVSRLSRNPGPLYISLTTSIADDFIDRDENIKSAHMMLLYLFVFSSLRHRHWFNGEVLEAYQRLIYPLVGAFVGENHSRAHLQIEELEKQADRSAWRIGNFFETIVRGFMIDDAHELRSTVSDLGREFGNWCSHLDDVVDVERDILSGDTFTYPMFVLTRHSPALAQAVDRGDLNACLDAIKTDWFVDALEKRHIAHIASLQARAQSAGLLALEDKLANLKSKLPEAIFAIRQENSQNPLWQQMSAASGSKVRG